MPYKCEEYQEIKNILSRLLNYDIAELIIKELKFQENLIQCEICKKKKTKKQMADIEYICSPLCGFCGFCINCNKICYECNITVLQN
uniref:Uncharacterized protein n=1 Tax=Mimiviridae sp. ChoanoV1 TaxID=2596887 RepID=A0A5B8IG44_9VIRU|nr:hypothetical protein 3_26 [Mimiviridae sp. ChoanoV1]